MKKIIGIKRTVTIVMVLAVTCLTVIASEAVNAKAINKDGSYFAYLKTKPNKKNDAYIKKIKVKAKKIYVNGPIEYENKKGKSKVLKIGKKTFSISSKCKYFKMNYKENLKWIKSTKGKILKEIVKIEKVKNTKRFVEFVVKKGKVVKVRYYYKK